MNFFEKLASDLEKTAAFIETIEGKEFSVKRAEEDAKVKEAEEKRKAALAPLKEKLSNAVTDEDEIEEKLKTASVEALELIGKGLSSASKVDEGWGSVDENKGGKGKYAGYRDPLEAFAMGD
jgi:hypothetical protein